MERLTVVVGDVHGCIEELDELLKKIQYNPSQMRLIFAGDLVDRGPDSVGVVRRVRELNAECVMGNHEEKQLRWHKHEVARAETGKANPMKPMDPKDAAANAAFNDQDWSFLKNLPVKLHIGDNWWVVHAGCEPKFTLERQNKSQIMRVRYVDERGTGKALGPNLSQPEGTQYWDQLWKGPESIIYGHCVHDLTYPRITHVNMDVSCVGIDTGCCFGGHLTAAIFQREFPLEGGSVYKGQRYGIQYIQVKAKQKYFAGYGDE